MSDSVHSPTADRNLLFGILALQMNFITRDALVAAMHAWTLDKVKPLGRILLEQGKLTTDQLAALDAVLVQHLKAHGDDVERSLRAMGAATTANSTLLSLPDPDVQEIARRIGTQAGSEETASYVRPLSDGARFQRGPLHREGGLGKVFHAQDTELHREVALKEIKPAHADNPVSRVHFVIEAEITGGLEHPGIVPVYGLGAYDDGRPYYAMRFIRGNNLSAAIKLFHDADQPGRSAGHRSLALRQLLRRFVDVCNAVAYAHSRGVLHRDLKPANVMLGKFGETLVIDWGLARAGLEPKRASEDATVDPVLLPASGSHPHVLQTGGTPPFMSPEQAADRFDELTFASDIYSLGSTLYVLLTGKRPYDGRNIDEIKANVRKGQFKPPIEVKPDTAPALDAICRKAMSLKPADRYATPLDLAADIEHWLADEPVLAYPEPWAARAGRWARRHRAAVAGTAVFLVSAVVALSLSTALVLAEQQETEKQRLVAVKNYELSREQTFRIIKLIETTEPEIAAQPALHDRRREFLTAASDACRQFRERDPDDLELLQRSAQIFRFTANFHRLTNETREAETLYKDSILLQEKLADEIAGEPNDRLQLAHTLIDYANLNIKRCRFLDAAKSLNNAQEISDLLLKNDPNCPAYLRIKALVLHHQAAIDYIKGKPRMDAVLQSIRLWRGLMEGPPEAKHPYDPLMLAAALNSKALIEREAGQLKIAGATHREANAIMDEAVMKRPKMVSFPDLLHFRALCRVDQARSWAQDPKFLPLAERTLEETIGQWQGLVGNYPKIPMYQESLAIAYQVRGQMREELKRFENALDDFNKSQAGLVKLVDKFSDLPELHGELGKAYAGIGRVKQDRGEKDFAAWYQKAITELQRAIDHAPEHAELRRALDALKKLAS